MNSPALEVIVLCVALVDTSAASTAAPATTAPVGSVTVPLIPPRNVWPTNIAGAAISTTSAISMAVN